VVVGVANHVVPVHYVVDVVGGSAEGTAVELTHLLFAAVILARLDYTIPVYYLRALGLKIRWDFVVFATLLKRKNCVEGYVVDHHVSGGEGH